MQLNQVLILAFTGTPWHSSPAETKHLLWNSWNPNTSSASLFLLPFRKRHDALTSGVSAPAVCVCVCSRLLFTLHWAGRQQHKTNGLSFPTQLPSNPPPAPFSTHRISICSSASVCCLSEAASVVCHFLKLNQNIKYAQTFKMKEWRIQTAFHLSCQWLQLKLRKDEVVTLLVKPFSDSERSEHDGNVSQLLPHQISAQHLYWLSYSHFCDSLNRLAVALRTLSY